MTTIQAAIALMGIIAPNCEGQTPEQMIAIFETCHESVKGVNAK